MKLWYCIFSQLRSIGNIWQISEHSRIDKIVMIFTPTVEKDYFGRRRCSAVAVKHVAVHRIKCKIHILNFIYSFNHLIVITYLKGNLAHKSISGRFGQPPRLCRIRQADNSILNILLYKIVGFTFR